MAIDPRLLTELADRRSVARLGGGADKLEARRKKGVMTARERLDALYTPGTFMEWGMHASHDCHNFGMQDKELPCDGIVSGMGMVDGRPVAAFSQDFTVGGGSLGAVHAQKIACPVVGINDSGGARIQEGDDSLAGYSKVFYHNVLLSGVVPQISIIAGPCAGGAAYSPALMDFIIMVKGTSNLFICGPEVIQAVTGQKCTMDDIGSAQAHATVSGNIHFVAENDAHAAEIVRKLLSFLPPNNIVDPPHHPVTQPDLSNDPGMNELLPTTSKDPFDIYKVIARLVDGADFLEVQRDWARNIVVGFGRIQGIVVGIIANQPAVKAGTLDIDASDKSARFIRFCNAFNMPIVNLVDVPGVLPGGPQERGGLIPPPPKLLFY